MHNLIIQSWLVNIQVVYCCDHFTSGRSDNPGDAAHEGGCSKHVINMSVQV